MSHGSLSSLRYPTFPVPDFVAFFLGVPHCHHLFFSGISVLFADDSPCLAASMPVKGPSPAQSQMTANTAPLLPACGAPSGCPSQSAFVVVLQAVTCRTVTVPHAPPILASRPDVLAGPSSRSPSVHGPLHTHTVIGELVETLPLSCNLFSCPNPSFTLAQETWGFLAATCLLLGNLCGVLFTVQHSWFEQTAFSCQLESLLVSNPVQALVVLLEPAATWLPSPQGHLSLPDTSCHLVRSCFPLHFCPVLHRWLGFIPSDLSSPVDTT